MKIKERYEQLQRFFLNIKFMFSRSWIYARKTWGYTIINFVVNIIQPFAVLILPKFILDELAGLRRMDVTLKYVLLYASILIFFNVINLLISHFSTIQSIKTSHAVDMENQRKWLAMDYCNLESGEVRELAMRSFNKVDPQSFFDSTVCGFFQSFIQLAGYAYIISSLHPIIILFVIAVIAINSFVGRKLKKIDYTYEPIFLRMQRRCDYIMNLMTNLNVAKEIRINGGSLWLSKKYHNETEKMLEEKKHCWNQKCRWKFVLMLVELVQTVVIYAYCSYLAIGGDITVGSFTVFLGAVTAFAGTFSAFIDRFHGLVQLNRYVDDYRNFESFAVHQGAEREIISGEQPTGGKYDIKFVDVSFKYPNTDNFVLRHINLTIRSGERLAVVGYNGSGKSTLIKLLCRIYEPTEGKIYVGDVDISTIKPADYHEILSVVFQNYILFAMSIRDNIVLNGIFEQDRLDMAIENSGLKERISILADGVETYLFRAFEPEGIVLSGGEEQKLACSRAYYRDRPVVILDEPTASLDPIAESLLYKRFDQIIGKKTSIYISHRLASARFCDRIVVFVDGKIVESGTHEELIAREGLYADMFKKQAKYYLSDVS